MKRSLFGFGLLISLALNSGVVFGAPQAALSETVPMLQVGARAEPCLRLRAGASADHRIIDCLEPGTRLRALGNISDWSHIRLLDGTEGWIAASFLEKVAGLPTAQPMPASSAGAASAGDARGQIVALEGQLAAAAMRYQASEERLRRTIEAAESAQRETDQLRQQVQQLQAAAGDGSRTGRSVTEIAADSAQIRELQTALADAEERELRAAGLNAAQERRIEALETSLEDRRGHENAQQQKLTAAEGRVRAAEETIAKQAKRIAQLEAEPPPDLKRQLKEAKTQLRAAEESRTAQAARIAELEADQPAARDREAKLRQDLAAAEERARAAEEANAKLADRIAQLEAAPPPDSPRKAVLKRQLKEVRTELRAAREATAQQAARIAQLEAKMPVAREAEADTRQELAAAQQREAEQAQLIEELTGKLANAELRLAETELEERLASRGEPAPQAPTESLVKVRTPIVSAPEPPKVSVRMPAAVAEDDATPAKEPAEATPTTTEAAIDAVRAWAAAWSDQRVDDYLSFYAAGFQPPNGLGRDAWEAQRRQRLRAPSFIRVTISSLETVLLDDDTIRATFGQEYASDTFADSVTKVLTLVAADGTWRIVEEQSTARR